ncbi:MAG: hypothetical protein A2Y93_05965 [Chloroflexi bacterium RBG_13_68_17]|nr:MAG: hypothetical protein A2Y93_05965 [Chloroflexi bacterium RBG_13_68_17]
MWPHIRVVHYRLSHVARLHSVNNANTLHRRFAFRLLSIVVSAAYLAACGAAPGGLTAAPSAEAATVPPAATRTQLPTPAGLVLPEGGPRVIVWLSWGPEEIRPLLRLAELFREDHPEVQLEVVYYPEGELAAAFTAARQAGAGPTVLIGPDTWGPPLWEQSTIEDLTELMASALREALYPVALTQAEFAGIVLGLPLEMHGTVLYARAAQVPAPVETVDAWPEAAASGSRAAFDLGVEQAGSFLNACGGDWIDESGAPAFQSAAGLCWLQVVQSLSQAGTVPVGSGEDLRQFESGQAGWMLGSTRDLERLRVSIGEVGLRIDPWPAVELGGRRLSGFVHTVNAYLAAGLAPDDLQASWSFVASLLSPEAQQEFADPNGANHLPTIQGVVLQDSLRAAALSALVTGVPYPTHPLFAAYLVPLQRAIDTTARQEGDLQLILERAAQEVGLALAATPTPP